MCSIKVFYKVLRFFSVSNNFVEFLKNILLRLLSYHLALSRVLLIYSKVTKEFSSRILQKF